MRDHIDERTFHQERVHEFTVPPAMPWACRKCGRGYAHLHNGKCLDCPGLLVRVPYVEEAPDVPPT